MCFFIISTLESVDQNLYSYFQMSLDWRFNKYAILDHIQNPNPWLCAVILTPGDVNQSREMDYDF